MILTEHFTFFLLNVAVWAGLGLGIAYLLFKNNKRVKKATKLLTVGLLGSITGGLFGFLFNGMPDIGSQVNNLATALIFGSGSVLLLLPRQRISRKRP